MSPEKPFITDIVSQFSDECAPLWLQRSWAIYAPDYDLSDIAEIDTRIDAFVDALCITGGPAWELCTEALEKNEPGEVFTAAVFAFMNNDGGNIDMVTSTGSHTKENLKALVSALGWVRFEHIEPLLHSMMNANDNLYRYLGISAYAVHRHDPRDRLKNIVNDQFPLIKSRSLRVVGELKRMDLHDELNDNFQSDNEDFRFWSAWSSILLGEHSAINVMQPFFTVDSPYFERAMQLVLRVLDLPTAQNWLKGLAQFPDTQRQLIQGSGIVGDPMYVDWLIKQMNDKKMARIAGEAFCMITGISLEEQELDFDPEQRTDVTMLQPAMDEAGKEEDDPDEDLPWPDPGSVYHWWRSHKDLFAEGTRYLAGQPITVEHCREVLKTGYQPQRAAAALELAIQIPNEPLFNVHAPGYRQKKLLGI